MYLCHLFQNGRKPIRIDMDKEKGSHEVQVSKVVKFFCSQIIENKSGFQASSNADSSNDEDAELENEAPLAKRLRLPDDE